MRRGWGEKSEGRGKQYRSRIRLSPPLPLLWGLVECTHIHTPTQLPSNNRQLQKGKKPNKKEVNPSPPLHRVHASPRSDRLFGRPTKRGGVKEEGKIIRGGRELKNGCCWVEDKEEDDEKMSGVYAHT